jgi:hypothetical protein
VLGETPVKPAYETGPLAAQLTDLPSGQWPRSVLLVGASSVGKTAAVLRHREEKPR